MAKRKPVRTGPRPLTAAAVGRSTRQVTPAPPQPAPTTSGARATLERLSARPMARLGLLPTSVLPVVLLVLVLAGLLIPANWAGALLIVVGLFLMWLTALTWPTTSPSGRALRVVVNLVLLGLGVTRVLGLLV